MAILSGAIKCGERVVWHVCIAIRLVITNLSSEATVDRIYKASYKYRWELTLFIGIPLAVDAVSWAIWQFITIRPDSFVATFTFHRSKFIGLPYSFFILKALALGILWLRLRRLNRRHLSLIWLYALASATALVVVPLVTHVFADLFGDDALALPAYRWFLSIQFWMAQSIVQFTILACFTVLASKSGLRHALMFICLAMAISNGMDVLDYVMHLVYPTHTTIYDASGDELYSGRLYFYVPTIIFKLVMIMLAVVLLARHDAAKRGISSLGMAVAFGVALLAAAPYWKIYWIKAWHYSGDRGFLDMALVRGSFENFMVGYPLVIAITYIVWILTRRENALPNAELVAESSQSHNADDSSVESNPQDAGRLS